MPKTVIDILPKGVLSDGSELDKDSRALVNAHPMGLREEACRTFTAADALLADREPAYAAALYNRASALICLAETTETSAPVEITSAE